MRTKRSMGGAILAAIISATGLALNASSIWPAIDWGLVAAIAFAAFVVIVWQGWSASEHRARQYETSRPKIVCTQIITRQHMDEQGKLIYFATQVWFINSPSTTSEHSTAKSVTASVTFYDEEKRKEFAMHGCFTQTSVPESAGINRFSDLRDEIATWPPNDIAQKLPLALQWPDDEIAYGLARSNLNVRQLKAPGKKLVKGIHFVEVLFRGVGVDRQLFWFSLNNLGRGDELSVTGPIRRPV
jgi:hypothetical protein